MSTPKYSLNQIQELLGPIQIVTMESKLFPVGLKSLPDCPPFLFAVGDTSILNKHCISIVGTRNSCEDGNRIAYSLSRSLANEQFIIVSGFANGIDTNSHLGAISTGKTIAILAYGFQWISPSKISLARNIIESGGLILSEFFPDFFPQKFYFLKRNRLIATISICTVIVEAPQKSGALHTATIAKDFNKPIFVVPWSITNSRGIGSNNLIQNCGILLTSYLQILDYFHDLFPTKLTSLSCNDMQHEKIIIPNDLRSIYNFIHKYYPISKDDIYSHFNAESIASINTKLSLLELDDFILEKESLYYIKESLNF